MTTGARSGGRGAELDVAAALRAGEDRERGRRQRRAVLVGLAALAVAVGLAAGGRVLLRPSLADLARDERAGWQDAQLIAPSDEGAAGEQVLPFEGFGIAADSEPPGAEVLLGEQVLGRTPLATSVACAAGERLTVLFRLAGRPARQLHTTCRREGLVKLKVQL